MLISSAWAAAGSAAASSSTAGDATQAFIMNMLLILTLVVLFYFMMIVPQQKRFRRHKEMLDQMKKGDAVVTAGGLVGKIDKVKDGDEKEEVVVDLGNNIKVTALRSTVQMRQEKDLKKDVK